MKKLTKLALIGVAILIIGAATVTALAATHVGPGSMTAGFGNRAYVSSTTASGDLDKLEALQAKCLDRMKAVLDARVAAGTMTQAQEGSLLAAMKERQEAVDRTGYGYGMMSGTGYGYGMMSGTGYGYGYDMMGGRFRKALL